MKTAIPKISKPNPVQRRILDGEGAEEVRCRLETRALIQEVRTQLGSELADSALEVARAILESWRDLNPEERAELSELTRPEAIPEIVIRSHVEAIRERASGESLAEVRARAVERLRNPESRSLLERSLREARAVARTGRR